MNKLLEKIELELWPIGEEEGFVNTNTPEDWVMAGGKLA